MSELVLQERHGAVAVVTLNNEKTRNALSRDMLFALAECLEGLNDDGDVRAIVLKGANGHFCSGGDVSGMSTERPLPVGRGRMVLGHRVIRAVLEGTKPVVALVEGYAAGAGFSLAMAADFVVAAPTAKFVSSFAKVGLIPDLGLLWTLPQRIGLAQAKRIFYSARVVASGEAAQLGIVDELLAEGTDLQARSLEIAAEFTANAPLSVALVRSALARGVTCLGDALDYEMDNQAALYLTRDHREAVDAFLNKRAPGFVGL
ncbi:enoyl-CoA hydratase/isomerase family protein [Pseudomonas aeruginosa]|uniref:enoyl-CoA hydratase/isomerase family protein n=1 Tax=Pseudomonas aeruginosa TaxID=287 RepID=UPI00071B0A94|nr:enoyl-CoA hydratase/isomerase family protein [Pseudomonas aeruginosa]KSQ25010.1 enoyl-CoA hydratase [Pseudomonas aeruginosa]MCO1687930.1 enoyl-CoA hydratase/isomerase family protein [Pseudomonas aeruginosa]MCO1778568.1 enoyl-CoA hydratase/isomerase family protein [Pseudomonas aeruginosa]MCO1790123.1 enoyl-CoA hydratase/isomerase family protein [Pseudomonas aeruginosa]MCO1799237.1 enoyl-CoA hydratase/isomerase family protein [Pseudomonas aeruginosa]